MDSSILDGLRGAQNFKRMSHSIQLSGYWYATDLTDFAEITRAICNQNVQSRNSSCKPYVATVSQCVACVYVYMYVHIFVRDIYIYIHLYVFIKLCMGVCIAKCSTKPHRFSKQIIYHNILQDITSYHTHKDLGVRRILCFVEAPVTTLNSPIVQKAMNAMKEAK